MEFTALFYAALTENWTIWMLSGILVLAAVIDGRQLRVPNWLTFPLVLSGWLYHLASSGPEGLVASLLGTAAGLALLLPAYAIGGMGAGDVKLLAGVGAWVHAVHTLGAFAISAIVGGVLAVALVLLSSHWRKHWDNLCVIAMEIMTVRDPEQLACLAAQRKSSMLLLPYGIPLMIGTIAYFAWQRMLM